MLIFAVFINTECYMPALFAILCQETYNAWNIVKEKEAMSGEDTDVLRVL